MAGFSRQNAEQLRATLLDATIKCSERCLYQSAKWYGQLSQENMGLISDFPTRAAELSASLSPHLDEGSDAGTEADSPTEDAIPTPAIVISPSTDPYEARLEAREAHRYLLAKSHFDCKEFERCAAVFLPSGLPRNPLTNTSSNIRSPGAGKSAKGKGKETATDSLAESLPHISQRSLFLALYAKYISGEKRKEEESEMILGPADKGSVVNRELVDASRLLQSYFGPKDNERLGGGWLEYLYGIILAKGKNEEDAKHWLIKSVHLFPYNWGAWLELNDLIGGIDELNAITRKLPQNVMTLIFHLYANQELYQSTEQIHQQLSDLENLFPENHFLRTQRALLHYHAKEFEPAEQIFSQILQADPYRIDSLDHYSNILYVMNERPKLAFIAQLATATDKFRPETCCVVGNYYSLKSEHEKAVQYFRRALTLDRSFLSAWTLMGHEYVEMKNTHAAIESYRRAVDVNRRDYRAWYGLGQTYEVLEMHLYALYYYRRAALLRPYDSKMWHAVGSCFDKVGKPTEGIKAYKRALAATAFYDAASSFGSGGTGGAGSVAPDGWMIAETLYSIALMYEKLNNHEEAASYMETVLAQEEGPDGDDEDGDEDGRQQGIGVTNTTSKARMWLARWEYGKGGFARAMELANELCQDGVEVEEAKALIRDLRARIDNDAG
ncbi:MAG: Anaphase-promoting complex subunit 23 [Stictis urceolatum]|nr:Anaphase-promoting complex subunit 23 [Stictis urceolata]